jgi:hypothetical protein
VPLDVGPLKNQEPEKCDNKRKTGENDVSSSYTDLIQDLMTVDCKKCITIAPCFNFDFGPLNTNVSYLDLLDTPVTAAEGEANGLIYVRSV